MIPSNKTTKCRNKGDFMNKEQLYQEQRKYDSLIQYIENNSGDAIPSLIFDKEEVPLLKKALVAYREVLENKKTDEELLANTEITYIHREPETNNKTWFTVILKGRISEEQMKELKDNLYDSDWNFFYPDKVGLPYENTEDVYELCTNSFVYVDKTPTVHMSVDKLVRNFKKAKETNWGHEQDYER